MLWSESFWPQRLSCHYPWPSWNNLLRITGAKLNMSLGRDGDVWKRADFSKVFLGRWHLLHRAEQGFVGSDRLTDGFFTLALVHISGEGGVSQAWRMCFECQSCLMSSLSYPQVALWVQTSAAEWAPALVRVVCIYHTCVFAVSIDRRSHSVWFKASFSRLVPPRIFTQRAAVGCRGEGP